MLTKEVSLIVASRMDVGACCLLFEVLTGCWSLGKLLRTFHQSDLGGGGRPALCSIHLIPQRQHSLSHSVPCRSTV